MGSSRAGGGDVERLMSGGMKVVGPQNCKSSAVSRALGFGILVGDDA